MDKITKKKILTPIEVKELVRIVYICYKVFTSIVLVQTYVANRAQTNLARFECSFVRSNERTFECGLRDSNFYIKRCV